MTIAEKAKELGEMIVDSSEYDELKEAEQAMEGNDEAKEILEEFQAQQKKMQMAQQNGKQITQDMQKEMQGLQAKMEQNEKIKEFMEAQQKFNKVMQTVNQVIQNTMKEASQQ